MTAFPYPLAWPGHIPRSSTRETGNFRTQLTGALNNVRKELQLFSRDSGKTVTDVVISSNVTLGETRPKDPGVAVWFRWDGMQLCIPVDRYASPEANLQAIYHVLDARRTELRHAEGPLSSRDIAREIVTMRGEDARDRKYLSDLTKRVSKALRSMKAEGHVKSAVDAKGNVSWERR